MKKIILFIYVFLFQKTMRLSDEDKKFSFKQSTEVIFKEKKKHLSGAIFSGLVVGGLFQYDKIRKLNNLLKNKEISLKNIMKNEEQRSLLTNLFLSGFLGASLSGGATFNYLLIKKLIKDFNEKQKTVEKIVEVEKEVIKEVIKEVEVKVEVPVEKIVEVEKIVAVEKIVEKIVEVEVPVEVEVEKIGEVEKILAKIAEAVDVVEKIAEGVEVEVVEEGKQKLIDILIEIDLIVARLKKAGIKF